MIKKLVITMIIITAFCFSAFSEPKPDDLVFFANKASVKQTDLSLKELEQIYLSKLTAWPDKKSGSITPFNIAMDTPERDSLQKSVLKMSSEDEKKYWVQKRIEGKENPPESKKSAAMVQMMVSKMNGAVGYCFYKDIQASIKDAIIILKIDGKEGL
ncbi:hypothetical protein KA977_01820 [Candidatus Dependentiae bacterium]|nr:hypothetical protein [Candidatus Dependentiae bacterium]